MKIVVIAPPEMLPPELAENPDVVVLDPAAVPEELLMGLDAVSGGMLGEDNPEEGGEGPLTEWASEEEREHGAGGYGDDDKEEREGGGADDDEETDPIGGEGDEEEERRPERKPEGGTRGRGGRGGRGGDRFGVTISGRGAAIPALSRWAAGLGAPRR